MEHSFKKGYNQLAVKDAPEVREKIMKVLGLKNRATFYSRMNGAVEPRVSEAQAIEAIFLEYNITEVWGDEEENENKALPA